MRKFTKRLATLSLLGLLGMSTFGCGSKKDTTPELIVTPFTYESGFQEDLIDESQTIEDNIEEKDIDIIEVDVVIADARTKIYGPLDKKDLLGYLPVGRTLEIVSLRDDGYVQVDYYGKEAYVKEKDVSIAKVFDINSEINKILYAVEDVNLVIPDYLSDTNTQEVVTIPQFECFEVYYEDETVYFVKTEDYIGYIGKNNVAELDGTSVVIDISKQKLTLYKDNQVFFECPVVTGTPTEARHTDEGIWAICSITGARYLIGSGGSRTPVDIMLKFNPDENEGLHDASYDSCSYWQKKGRRRHGWRADWEFGGDTYLTNGSHGCCNMMRDDVFYVAEYVEVGTPVLVKK